MEDNKETKALTDLIQNPQEISNIINNPADNGMKFYQSLRNKDKQYVAFAAGLGLIAYGFFLNRSSKPSTGQASYGKKGKNKNQGGNQASLDQSTATGAGSGYGGDISGTPNQSGDYNDGGFSGGDNYNQNQG